MMQHWCDMVKLPCSGHDTRCCILDSLEFCQMSIGYGWEGIRQRRCLVRAMYLSASEVSVSIYLGRYRSVCAMAEIEAVV